MNIHIVGRHLPGRWFVSDGEQLEHVHVAVQQGKDPVGLVAGDAAEATWDVDVRTVTTDDGTLDVRGPAVHGRRGERFMYLTWGDVDDGGTFTMFRRAKLMFSDVDAGALARAADGDGLLVDVDLTDEHGCPRCARLRPPAIRWSVRGEQR